MGKGRMKMHICLISIVLAATVIGLFYYYNSDQRQMEEAEGVLVKNIREVSYECE